MDDKPTLTFPAFFDATLSRHGDRDAYVMIGRKAITYRETDRQIRAVIAFLEKTGIQPGDKVAILSSNQPNWAIAYFAITFMGAVAVPLLPDFMSAEIASLLEHSETKAVFVSAGLIPKLAGIKTGYLEDVISIENFSVLRSTRERQDFDAEAQPSGCYRVAEDDLAAIIYTSGTTGRPKGVMLTHRNICFIAIKGFEIQHIAETDRFLSILPLSHTYENTLGLILPMYRGACVYYLGKAPTPSVLIPALQEVRPTTILTVPLIIEKIFRSKILPTLTGTRLKALLYKVPPARRMMHRVAGKKLMQTFGGAVTFFGVGGAKLDRTVERFLIESRFPYAVGYGLTECAPLLAGFNPQHAVFRSTGPAFSGVELKLVDAGTSPGEGEIWAKGPNIMRGYYKDPVRTAGMITPDGWLKTGDLGSFDKYGNLFIKGRVKNVIVRSNGENIYPEDIETVINNFRHVVDSLVVEKKGKLVALVHFDKEEIETRYQALRHEVSVQVDQKIEELRLELQEYVNQRVNKFSQVQLVIAQPDPFQKTATQKIKRFIYS